MIKRSILVQKKLKRRESQTQCVIKWILGPIWDTWGIVRETEYGLHSTWYTIFKERRGREGENMAKYEPTNLEKSIGMFTVQPQQHFRNNKNFGGIMCWRHTFQYHRALLTYITWDTSLERRAKGHSKYTQTHGHGCPGTNPDSTLTCWVTMGMHVLNPSEPLSPYVKISNNSAYLLLFF